MDCGDSPPGKFLDLGIGYAAVDPRDQKNQVAGQIRRDLSELHGFE